MRLERIGIGIGRAQSGGGYGTKAAAFAARQSIRIDEHLAVGRIKGDWLPGCSVIAAEQHDN